jgi:hypothetical protein
VTAAGCLGNLPSQVRTVRMSNTLAKEAHMAITTMDLREATNAVALASLSFPLIEPRGIGPYVDPYQRDQHSLDDDYGLEQVATAIEYLLTFGLDGPTDSYEVKHLAEYWGRRNGMAPYVSNGAMIVASCYLGFAIDGDLSGNVRLG